MVVRVSDSCTTGWFTWGHGELWLTPSTLVRIPQATLTRQAMRRGVRDGVSREAVRGRASDVRPEAVDEAEWSRRIAASDRTLSVDLTSIRHADLARGRLTSRLSLELGTGERHKLLWLRNDRALPLVERAVTDPAGHRAYLMA